MFSKARIFHVVVVAVSLIACAGFALASPPVGPPFEGFLITTSCDVEVAGDFVEQDSFTWTYVDDTMNPARVQNWVGEWGFPMSSVDPMFLAPGGRAAEVRYLEDLNAVDGSLVQFNKAFGAESHSSPNLDVSKDFGYVASGASMIANALDEERVALSIVANGDDPIFHLDQQFVEEEAAGDDVLVNLLGAGAGPAGGLGEPGLADMPMLCPWVQETGLPATNEFIAAGSAISTRDQMVSHTDSDVRVTVAPELNHNISAEGTGTVIAQMRVELMEGDGPLGADVTTVTDLFTDELLSADYDFTIPDLISRTVYDERTSASGVINSFQKDMHYHSTIPAWQLPEPWYEIQYQYQ